MSRRGFTMMEILTVIAIIAVLAAGPFPVFALARESARRRMCGSHLEQIAAALHLYAQDNGGRFPRRDNDFAPLLPYTKSRNTFWCPSDSNEDINYTQTAGPGMKPKPPKREVGLSYVYKGGLTDDDRKDMIIAGESQAFHGDTVNILYLGGRVESLRAQGYVPICKAQAERKRAISSGRPGARAYGAALRCRRARQRVRRPRPLGRGRSQWRSTCSTEEVSR